jgi:hypothetical protein
MIALLLFALPSPVSDLPFTDKIAEPILLSDGSGHFYIFSDTGNRSGPLFAGDGKVFYEQRIVASSRAGADTSLVFWDPRFSSAAERSFDRKAEHYTLTCGAKTIALQLTERVKFADASLRQARWQREAVALAVDDTGIYYYVDRGRANARVDDFQLFIGQRGRLALVKIEKAPPQAFVTARGTLTIAPAGVTWNAQKLSLIDLDKQAAFIYTKLGAYPAEKLASACDPYF